MFGLPSGDEPLRILQQEFGAPAQLQRLLDLGIPAQGSLSGFRFAEGLPQHLLEDLPGQDLPACLEVRRRVLQFLGV
jgi:hypothetical protein